jgi:hypothetical protein
MHKWMYTAAQRKIDGRLLKDFPHNPELRLGVRNEIRQARRQNRIEKIKVTKHKQLWGGLLRDLNYEHNNVRQGMKYATAQPQPERLHAFEQYLLVMDKVRTVIEDARYSVITAKDRQGNVREIPNPTPSDYAKWKNANSKQPIPNNGIHWTDWVPARIKLQVAELFTAIPHTPKAKRKIPFQRTQRPRSIKRNKQVIDNPALKTLIKRTEKELTYVKQELDIAPNDPTIRMKYNQMQQALTRMREMKPNEAVPHTWHGLYKFERPD